MLRTHVQSGRNAPDEHRAPKGRTDTLVYTIRIISSRIDFSAIEADWRSLEDQVPDAAFFTGFDWCDCWWSAFGRHSGRKLAILAVYSGEELQAILPLTTARAWFFTSARLIGDDTGQYADCLVRPERRGDPVLARAVISGLKRLGLDRITLSNCRDDSALIELLGPVRGGKSWIVAAKYSNAEVRPSGFADFEAYKNTLSSNLKKGLRRRRRKLSELGEVQYHRLTDPGKFAAVAKFILKLKLDWLDAYGLHGRFLAIPGLEKWMTDIMHRAQSRGQLHLSVICVGDRICAAQLAFQTPNKVMGYFSAFDISLSRHAVGKLHLEDLIEDMFTHNQTLDLMPPSDAYKREWGVEVMDVAAYTVPLTPLGALVSQIYSVKTRALTKAAYLRIPEKLRAGIAAALLDTVRRLKPAFSGPAAPVSLTNSPLSPPKLKRTES